MNGFQLCGDILHLLAFIILQEKIWRYNSCAGISGKTQFLYALVFTTRYMYDLVTVYISFYNTSLKIVFLLFSYVTLFLIYVKFRRTCDPKFDSFWASFLILLAAVLALCVHYANTLNEICWAFSLYLEAVAIWPQLYHVAKVGRINGYICAYLTSLGLYRAFYIGNWIYRYQIENHVDIISSASGTVQTLAYVLFLGYAIWTGITVTGEDVPPTAKYYETNLFVITLPEDTIKNQKLLASETKESSLSPTVFTSNH